MATVQRFANSALSNFTITSDWYGGTIMGNDTAGSTFAETTNPTIWVESNWGHANVEYKRKRRQLFGKKSVVGDGQVQARLVFHLIKKGLSKQQKEKFAELADKAFQEAVKNDKLGLTSVAKSFEKEMEKNLKLATIQTMGYDALYITEKQVEKYKDKLSSNKALVIDDLEEYDKPIPSNVQIALKSAKEAELFDTFCIFWIREVKDPILFGQIEELPDRYYFIAEWNKDISVKELMRL